MMRTLLLLLAICLLSGCTPSNEERIKQIQAEIKQAEADYNATSKRLREESRTTEPFSEEELQNTRKSMEAFAAHAEKMRELDAELNTLRAKVSGEKLKSLSR